MIILLPFNFSVALIISLYYFWRYSHTKANITLSWALGFFGVFLGLTIYYFLEYIYYDWINIILPNWDYESLFLTGSMVTITTSLSYSTFYFTKYPENIQKIGLFTIAILGLVTMTLLIINSIIFFDVFNIINWICRGLAIYIAGFFLVFSLKDKIYKALFISISLIFALLGGILMASEDFFLALIGNILQFTFYILLSIGLFYAKKYS